jgi:hypothetical protein
MKIIKLNESDLSRIVRRVIKESQDETIVYLHGLDAVPIGEKINFLYSLGYDVFSPHLNYRNEDSNEIFDWMVDEISKKNVKLIIGSSLGGFLAYCLCKKLNIPGLLFNPVLDPKIPMDRFGISFDTSGEYNPKIEIVMGELDELLPPEQTIDWIKSNVKDDNYDKHIIPGMKHRTPIDVFVKWIEKRLSSK